MDVTTLATIAAAVSALISGIAAVGSVVLTYRNIRLLENERAASNRQTLYNKTLELFPEIIERIIALQDATIEAISEFEKFQEEKPTEEEWRAILMDHLRATYEITMARRIWAYYLSDNLIKEISNYVRRTTIIGTSWDAPAEEKRSMLKTFTNLIVQIMRDELGIDHLSQQTLQIIYQHSKQESLRSE